MKPAVNYKGLLLFAQCYGHKINSNEEFLILAMNSLNQTQHNKKRDFFLFFLFLVCGDIYLYIVLWNCSSRMLYFSFSTFFHNFKAFWSFLQLERKNTEQMSNNNRNNNNNNSNKPKRPEIKRCTAANLSVDLPDALGCWRGCQR